ncbi:hypothetical protein MMC29_003047 [Sticta canariensis]|nr:hypothetical protein [Sticta canariensis]
MPFNPLRAALPIAAVASTVHAEPSDQHIPRKPIYDDVSLNRQPSRTKPPSDSPQSTSATPTDRLATQVCRVRLFAHAHASAAEDRVNSFMSSVLVHERSFTQTIASLAPPPESQERLMPGSLYVLVAAMTGSIVSRNRNIFLRATVPAAIGLGAAWVVLPSTMRNVGDLVWTFEEKVPVISLNHLRIRGAVEEAVKESKSAYTRVRGAIDQGVTESREAIEGWVRKGR